MTIMMSNQAKIMLEDFQVQIEFDNAFCTFHS